MREIKFKIWYPDSKIMEGPFDIDLLYIPNSVHPKFAHSDRHYYLQYTSLKDIHSKEIYEGDILESKEGDIPFYHWSIYHKHFKGVVGLDDGCFRVLVNNIAENYVNNCFIRHTGCRVIGNIYENPELLESLK